MNLSNVKIKNFRNIEELDINFKPGFNLIKGKNGKGKTPAEIAPGTKVYELVEELAKYLPEEVKKQFMEG